MKKTTRFFRLGCWTLVATAALHMVGFFSPQPPPADETDAKLRELAETYHWSLMGMERSLMDFLHGFSLVFAVFAAFVGVLGLLTLRRGGGRPDLLRGHAVAYLVLAAALLALSLAYFIPPPIVSFAVATVFFGLAAGFSTVEGQGEGGAAAG